MKNMNIFFNSKTNVFITREAMTIDPLHGWHPRLFKCHRSLWHYRVLFLWPILSTAIL